MPHCNCSFILCFAFMAASLTGRLCSSTSVTSSLLSSSRISSGYSFSIGLASSLLLLTLSDADLISPSIPVCSFVTTPILHWLRGVLSWIRTTSPMLTAAVLPGDRRSLLCCSRRPVKYSCFQRRQKAWTTCS